MKREPDIFRYQMWIADPGVNANEKCYSCKLTIHAKGVHDFLRDRNYCMKCSRLFGIWDRKEKLCEDGKVKR